MRFIWVTPIDAFPGMEVSPTSALRYHPPQMHKPVAMPAARDVMEYDVLIVGAGPAGLAAAIRIKQLDSARSVCVLEQAASIGGHTRPGAVMEPGPLDALWPHWRQNMPARCVPVMRDEFRRCTTARFLVCRSTAATQSRQLHRIAGPAGALARHWPRNAWRRPVAGFCGRELLFDATGCVAGVRMGDMGLDADGNPGRFHPRPRDPRANHADRGRLPREPRQAAHQPVRSGPRPSPQTYALGFKELWQLPAGRGQPGLVQHSLGWPLDKPPMAAVSCTTCVDQAYVGYVIGLDYLDPRFTPFEAFQQFKHHPPCGRCSMAARSSRPARAASPPAAGSRYPRLDMPGAMLLGDAAGTLNFPKIKGIHQALRSGMLAAAHLVETGGSAGFDARWRASEGGQELRKVRNIKPGFKRGLWFGLANGAVRDADRRRSALDAAEHQQRSRSAAGQYESPDRDWLPRTLPPRDRLASVYFAQTSHDEAQPVHLRVADTHLCATRCATEFGNPCTRFCPAQCLRNGGRWRRRQAPADERGELRALQGLRHQGPLRGDHLDHARRRHRPQLLEPVNTPTKIALRARTSSGAWRHCAKPSTKAQCVRPSA